MAEDISAGAKIEKEIDINCEKWNIKLLDWYVDKTNGNKFKMHIIHAIFLYDHNTNL